MTTFPLRLLSLLGAHRSRLLGFGFGVFLLVHAAGASAPEWAAEGVFTLFAMLFVFVGAQFVGLGLLGEYLGRIYHDVRARPRYFVQTRRGAGAVDASDASRAVNSTWRMLDESRRSRLSQHRLRGHRSLCAARLRDRGGLHPPGRPARTSGSARSPSWRAEPRHPGLRARRTSTTRVGGAHPSRWQPDIIFSFYYRDMVKPADPGHPAGRCLNLHGSLLPQLPRPLPDQLGAGQRRDRDRRDPALHDAAPDDGDIVGQERDHDRRRRHGADACTARLPRRQRACSTSCCRRSWRATAPRTPQDEAQASLLRRAHARRTARSTGRTIRRRSATSSAPSPGPTPAPSAISATARCLVWDRGAAGGRRADGAAPGTVLSVDPLRHRLRRRRRADRLRPDRGRRLT